MTITSAREVANTSPSGTSFFFSFLTFTWLETFNSYELIVIFSPMASENSVYFRKFFFTPKHI